MTRTIHLLFLVISLLYQRSVANDDHGRKLLNVIAYGANPNFKLNRCEGDCDSDNDCLNGMICFQRGANRAVPGCEGGDRDGSASDYCIRRSDLGGGNPPPPTPTPPAPTPIATNNGIYPELKWSTNFPLGLCTGDCDSDADCQGNLICHQRSKYQAVPGCRGGESNGSYTDYCIALGGVAAAPTPVARPVAAPTPQRQGSGMFDPNYRFQLRLYWESSYFWQETHRETWWCMQCTQCNKYSLGDGPPAGCRSVGDSGSSCREGHNIWIRKCQDHRNHEFNIIQNSGSGDQVRVDGTNLCLSTVNNRYLELRNCDRSNSRQLWKPIDNINRFELRPFHQRDWGLNDAKCLSQLHHPKDKELVGLHRCRTTRDHETMYWEEFH